MTQLSASVETIYKLRDDLHAVEALLGDLDNLCDAVAVHRTKLHAKRKVAEYQRHANTSLQTQMEDFRYKVRLEKAERNKPLAVRLKESMLSFAENVQQQRARAETPTVETAPGAAAGFAAAAAGSAVVAGGDGGGAAVEVPADGGAAVDGPADGGESAADGGESAADGAAGGEPETTPISEEANATGNAAELSAGDEEAVVAAGEEDETDEEEDDGKDDEEKETAKEDTAQEEAAPAESNADAGGKGGAKKKKGKKKK